MGENGKLSLTMEHKLINVEEMMKFEGYLLQPPQQWCLCKKPSVSDKTRQWKSEEEKNTYSDSKSSTTLLIKKEKIKLYRLS